MKNLNVLNIFLIVMSFVLIGIFAYQVVDYRQWNRYYYSCSVSNPKDFPIYLYEISFFSKSGERLGNFSIDQTQVNDLNSDWGKEGYVEAHKLDFLPYSLFVRYIDFRTKRFYQDTILLPQDTMRTIFENSRSHQNLQNLSPTGRKLGLKYHVGIAEDGHVVFWLLGPIYGLEFYHKQLRNKIMPISLASIQKPRYKLMPSRSIYGRNDKTFPERFDPTIPFKNIPDYVKQKILEQDVSNLHFRDSVPQGFGLVEK